MKVVGFERFSSALDEEVGSTWVIPPRHSAEDLSQYKDLISKAEFSPPTFEDGETAEDQIRRKTAPRKKVAYDDDEDNDNEFLDDGDGPLFPKNLPTKKKVGPGDDRPEKKRRRRRDALGSGGDELPSEEDDEVRAEKARKRRKRELEKHRKIKSALYVSPSDDESDAERDAEFFAREEALRQRVSKALHHAPTDVSQLQESANRAELEEREAAAQEILRRLVGTDDEDETSGDDETESSGDEGEKAVMPPGLKAKAGSRKRKSDVMLEAADEGEEANPPPAKKAAPQPKRKSRLGFLVDSSDEEEDEAMDEADPSSPTQATEDEGEDAVRDSDDEMETNGTPLSSNPKDANRPPLKEKVVNAAIAENGDDGDDDDDVAVATKRRPRVKAGFVLDDSDEE